MNREIKFRAWDGEKIVFSFLVARPQFADALSVMQREDFAKNKYKLKEWKLMQYTGLTDKNGKEIYEGDIIRKENGVWGVIVYKAPFFEVTISETQSSLYTKEWIIDSEVIGNIFENPELLKK